MLVSVEKIEVMGSAVVVKDVAVNVNEYVLPDADGAMLGFSGG